MQRRDGRGRPGKGRAKKPRARKGPGARTSVASLQERTRERDEALEQQAATSEILKLISSSPSDLQPVFDTIGKRAEKLCDADISVVSVVDSDLIRLVSVNGVSKKGAEAVRRAFPMRRTEETITARAIRTGAICHLSDVLNDAKYPNQGIARASGYRGCLGVPMVRDGEVVGAIFVARTKPGLFSSAQVELLKTFADQAVIAIGNAQLFSELRESLQQQTATADVLKVISSSPGELKPVFNAILENAVRICDAKFGHLWLREGDALRIGATYGAPDAFAAYLREEPVFRPKPETGLGQLLRNKTLFHLADITALPTYGDKLREATIKLAGARSLTGVPMVKDDDVIGAIVIYRQEVRPFTAKQIELVENFAAQAVIAIENARLLNELRQRTDDLTKSLEQQTATSEVLQVISSSSGALEPVFDTMLANAVRLCEAKLGTMFLYEGEDNFRTAALFGAPPAFAEARKKNPVLKARPGTGLGLVASTRKAVQIADIRAEPAYTSDSSRSAILELAGARTMLNVPMLKENELVGQIGIYRQEVRPFTEKQIELVENFAAQAVIAIENARLLNELRQRTDDLSESLEQQTATSEVLQVISSSPGELKPVFDVMLQNAVRICGAKFGNLMLREGDTFRLGATCGAPPAYVEYLRSEQVFPSNPGLLQLVKTKQHYHLLDLAEAPTFGDKLREATVALAGARTLVGVPMLKDDNVIGAIIIYRQEVRPFTEKQIKLVENFAAQAVIAIENTRLLSELRQRTDDLSESLEQQTATSEVLSIISSSAGELQPVFDTMLAKATELCEASYGTMWLREGDAFRAGAVYGALPEAFLQLHRSGNLHRAGPGAPAYEAINNRQTCAVADLRETRGYLEGSELPVAAADIGGVRTMVAVPMFREDEPIGVISIYRREVRPFSDKQIELVSNFAKQAVIAIENTRLLNELRESLQQQTATADVLKVISSSPGDLEPVFQAMLEKATQLCEAKFGVMFRFADGVFRATSWLGNPPAHIIEQPHVVSENPHNLLTRIVSTKQPAYSSDLTKEQAYIEGNPRYVALVETVGARSLLVVPMVKNEELIGAIAIYWQDARSFTEKQMELISNFAAQAVIAIDNARLLSELRESLQQQTATADVLKVISRSTFNLQGVLDTLVESAARLCEADDATIHRPKDDFYPLVANYGYSPEYLQYMRDHPIKLHRGSVLGRAVLDGKPVQVADVLADPNYGLGEQRSVGKYRTVLGVPLMREGTPIGVIMVTRGIVQPFSDKQIELVSIFADQAVIAIENVRLFDSVQARTRELAASLEDLRTTQDRLVQTQKLASLGQLTAGIAHEMKNPLNFVNNFSVISSELIDELGQSLNDVSLDNAKRDEIAELMETLRGNLDKVVQHGQRADTIVKNMLLHSREGTGEHRPVDINALVEESLNLAWHGARAEKQGFEITIKQSFDPSAGEIDVFPQDIRRALLNLISNGFYAAAKRRDETNGGYEPTLAASTKNLGDRVEIRIRDNGTGIVSDVKEKMFNPFFTTKPTGEGTGLGLSISHDILVKQHGGSIEVDTAPGEFTEIRITLPRAADFVTESGRRM
jgi:GAF domain-containing protein